MKIICIIHKYNYVNKGNIAIEHKNTISLVKPKIVRLYLYNNKKLLFI